MVLQFPELPRTWKPFCSNCGCLFEDKKLIKRHWSINCTREHSSSWPVQVLKIVLSAEYRHLDTISVRLDPSAPQPRRSPYTFTLESTDDGTWQSIITYPDARHEAHLLMSHHKAASTPRSLKKNSRVDPNDIETGHLLGSKCPAEGVSKSHVEGPSATKTPIPLTPQQASPPPPDVNKSSVPGSEAIQSVLSAVHNSTPSEEAPDISQYHYHYALSPRLAGKAILYMANMAGRCFVCRPLHMKDNHSMCECTNAGARRIHGVAMALGTCLAIANIPKHTYACCLFPKWLVPASLHQLGAECALAGMVLLSYQIAGMHVNREQRAMKWFSPQPPPSSRSEFAWMLKSCFIENSGPCTAIFLYALVCQDAIRVGPAAWTPPILKMRNEEDGMSGPFEKLVFLMLQNYISRILHPRKPDELEFGDQELAVPKPDASRNGEVDLKDRTSKEELEEHTKTLAEQLNPADIVVEKVEQDAVDQQNNSDNVNLQPADQNIEVVAGLHDADLPKSSKRPLNERGVDGRRPRKVRPQTLVDLTAEDDNMQQLAMPPADKGLDLTKTAMVSTKVRSYVDLTKDTAQRAIPKVNIKDVVDLTEWVEPDVVSGKSNRRANPPSDVKKRPAVHGNPPPTTMAIKKAKTEKHEPRRSASPLPEVIEERDIGVHAHPPAPEPGHLAPLYCCLKLSKMHTSCRNYTPSQIQSGRFPLRYTQHWQPFYEKPILSVCSYIESYSRDCSICLVSERYVPFTLSQNRRMRAGKVLYARARSPL